MVFNLKLSYKVFSSYFTFYLLDQAASRSSRSTNCCCRFARWILSWNQERITILLIYISVLCTFYTYDTKKVVVCYTFTSYPKYKNFEIKQLLYNFAFVPHVALMFLECQLQTNFFSKLTLWNDFCGLNYLCCLKKIVVKKTAFSQFFFGSNIKTWLSILIR